MAKEVFKSELVPMLARGAILVDVRELEELVADDGIPGVPSIMHAPLSRVGEWAGNIAKDRPTIFYCRSGSRSFQAAEIAANWTEQPVYYLSGGLLGYADA